MSWCWWCCHPFEGQHLEMPYKYDERTRKFHTTGTFCSWSCMKSFAIDKHGCNLGGRICGNILLMRKRMYGIMGHVKPAPYRYKLKVFGGDLDIEEFRAGADKDMDPPKPVDRDSFEDVSIPIISNNAKKLEEITSSEVQNEPLKLKRAKPLKRTHNNLESALGLVIKPKQLSHE